MVVGEFTQETDLVIIGGGPAGYSAAFRAAELGVQALVIDSRSDAVMGGVCLHEGCIPSKTLLHVADTVRMAAEAAQFGITFSTPTIDVGAVWAWKNKTVSKLASGLESLCRKHNVERLQARAHFEDSRTISLLEGNVPRVRFRRALITTGAMPREHAAAPFDGTRILTPGELLNLGEAPARLLIVGGDYIAAELASIFSALGSQVTIVNHGPRLLPEADADLARIVTRRLEPQLAAVHHNTTIAASEVTDDEVRVEFAGESAPAPAAFDRVVVSIGHISSSHGLALEKAQVNADADGFIEIDAHMRTSNPRIFAAGDVTGPPFLADHALHQGRIAAEVIAGHDSVFDARVVPMTIFTDPQLAWCGVTEESAKLVDLPHTVAKTPWGASGRAVGMGRYEGVTKVIYDPHSELVLGVGLAGPYASEMIAEAALAIEMGATLTDLAATIHPHPTISELLSDTARSAMSVKRS